MARQVAKSRTTFSAAVDIRNCPSVFLSSRMTASFVRRAAKAWLSRKAARTCSQIQAVAKAVRPDAMVKIATAHNRLVSTTGFRLGSTGFRFSGLQAGGFLNLIQFAGESGLHDVLGPGGDLEGHIAG
jgi:hypothetical protein